MSALFRGQVTFGMEALEDTRAPVQPFPGNDISSLVSGGRYAVGGMIWYIEYVAGDVRSGRSPSGSMFETEMPCAYGEIENTTDADGEPIDIIINQTNFSLDAPVRIMDMVSADSNTFDEHKLWVGYPTMEDVQRDYQILYGSAPVTNGGVTDLPIQKLQQWSVSPDTQRPSFDRDLALQRSTLAKIAEREVISIQTTDASPKIVISRAGANIRASIYILSEFDTEAWGTVTETILDLLYAAAEGDSVLIGISSWGGELDLAARIGSAIRKTKAHVTTISLGPVASAGCLLWSEGHTRLITRGSYFMQHDAGCVIGGKMGQIARLMEATNQYLKSVIFARVITTGLFTTEEISAMVDRSADIYISAREAARRTQSELV